MGRGYQAVAAFANGLVGGAFGVLLCWAVVGCGSDPLAPAVWPPANIEAIRDRGAAEVERQALAGLVFARQHPGTADGVRAAADAGRLALLLTGSGSRLLADARLTLGRALEDAGLPGLCEAGLVAARIERAVDSTTGAEIVLLEQLASRFAGLSVARSCLSEVAALHADWRASASHAGSAHSADLSQRGADGRERRSTLRRVRVSQQPSGRVGQVRVALSFDRPLPFRRSERPASGAAPRRVLLDLDGVTLGSQVQAVTTVGRGGVDRVRVLAVTSQSLRVSIDLTTRAQYRMSFLPDPYRLVLDFRARPPTGPSSGIRRVVLDPGHGGPNPGAKGPTGLRESDVALSIARRVRRALQRKLPGLQVLLTRDGDHDVSLEERAAVANAVDADLFVSIHLNASHSPEDQGGVSTFVLDTSNDQQALRLAARENGTAPERVSELQVVLASLHRRDQVRRSHRAATAIHRHTLAQGRRVLSKLPDRGVKSAMFYVLVGALMPAVLVEASFITRPEEERALRTDGYRTALSEGMAEGIFRYVTSARE